MTEFVIGEPAPICGEHRRYTSAHCELPPDHIVNTLGGSTGKDPWHYGRDKLGRWHSWPVTRIEEAS